MISFEQAWSYSQNITGAFTTTEARALYNECVKLPPKSVVVEIGSYLGRSSTLLAQVCNDGGYDLICVDPFHESDVNEFLKNMKGVEAKYKLMSRPDCWPDGRLSWRALMVGTVRAADAFKKQVDLLFVDGNHLYEGVATDLEVWIPKVKSGSPILFHDYSSSWEGVKRAVDERSELKDGYIVDSLAVKFKI